MNDMDETNVFEVDEELESLYSEDLEDAVDNVFEETSDEPEEVSDLEEVEPEELDLDEIDLDVEGFAGYYSSDGDDS